MRYRNETRWYIGNALTSVWILLHLALSAEAETINVVKVKLDCKAPDAIELFYNNDESYRVGLTRTGDAWIGYTPGGKVWINPNGTLGSALLHGLRTDAQLSVKDYHDNDLVAKFELHCTEHATHDVKIEINGSLAGSYVRTMPRNRGNERSRPSEIRGRLETTKTIPDLRFAPYYLDSRRSKPNPSDEYETLRLNLQLLPNRLDTCDLLVNDWKVIKEALKGLPPERIIELSAAQRNAGNGCQPPQLSPQELDFQKKTMPAEFKSMTITLVAPAK